MGRALGFSVRRAARPLVGSRAEWRCMARPRFGPARLDHGAVHAARDCRSGCARGFAQARGHSARGGGTPHRPVAHGDSRTRACPQAGGGHRPAGRSPVLAGRVADNWLLFSRFRPLLPARGTAAGRVERLAHRGGRWRGAGTARRQRGASAADGTRRFGRPGWGGRGGVDAASGEQIRG
jgi:hypothetical protein